MSEVNGFKDPNEKAAVWRQRMNDKSIYLNNKQTAHLSQNSKN